MVTIKKSLHLFAVVLFALIPLMSQASAMDNVVQETAEGSVHETHVAVDPGSKEFVQEFSDHHLMDDYFYSFFADAEKHKHYGFALPIILIDNGLKVFMSSEDFVYNGKVVEKDGQHYKFYHGKIYKTDATGTINYDEKHHPTNEKPLDFSITKNVFGLLLATVLMFLGFTALAKTYKDSANSIPKGIGRVLEPLVIYVRDEMARPNIGDKKYKAFMPYLLSVFFLIFLLNLMGLTPLGLNVTGNISVTFCLAIFTFLYTNFSGNKDYWKHIFWMPGVPVPMKIVLMPIEILGMFNKTVLFIICFVSNNTGRQGSIIGINAVSFVIKELLSSSGACRGRLLILKFFLVFKKFGLFFPGFNFT